MTKAAWFNINGKFNFWDSDQQPSESELEDSDGSGGRYIKADIDEDMPIWRLTYNYKTNVVDVYEPTLNTSDAEAKQLADMDAADSDLAAADPA
tara:strand:- start:58 stop:339 length:282 start_codon:yes stop_codon:yes gene_type:complete